MTQLSVIHPKTESAFSAFLGAHGPGLATVLAHLYGPLGSGAFNALVRIEGQPVHAREREFNIALSETVSMLLNFVGEPVSVPGTIRSKEFDAALCWYAARLTDLRDS
ncbi:MAG: hypothetical protein KDK11_00185 [Maritimibacter sp.]|nr:hypothetical protein [Maritimibacter sp.]